MKQTGKEVKKQDDLFPGNSGNKSEKSLTLFFPEKI
jgi:hypothetical protein